MVSQSSKPNLPIDYGANGNIDSMRATSGNHPSPDRIDSTDSPVIICSNVTSNARGEHIHAHW
jgi:hypothetical protein